MGSSIDSLHNAHSSFSSSSEAYGANSLGLESNWSYKLRKEVFNSFLPFRPRHVDKTNRICVTQSRCSIFRFSKLRFLCRSNEMMMWFSGNPNHNFEFEYIHLFFRNVSIEEITCACLFTVREKNFRIQLCAKTNVIVTLMIWFYGEIVSMVNLIVRTWIQIFLNMKFETFYHVIYFLKHETWIDLRVIIFF